MTNDQFSTLLAKLQYLKDVKHTVMNNNINDCFDDSYYKTIAHIKVTSSVTI